jgi:hypothetical protein
MFVALRSAGPNVLAAAALQNEYACFFANCRLAFVGGEVWIRSFEKRTTSRIGTLLRVPICDVNEVKIREEALLGLGDGLCR